MSEPLLSCSEFASAWERLDAGSPLPAHLAHHLRGCGRCRATAGSDPSRLFALLRGSTPEPAPAFEPMWQRARLEAERLRRERLRLRGWAVAAACGAVVAASAWLLVAERLAPPRLRPEGAEALAEGAGSGTPAPAGPGAVAAASLPTLESVASPEARVVEFRIFGEREQVTEVILILDRGVDL
jgi:predicted anti-sigma-YlaC factor YlaD